MEGEPMISRQERIAEMRRAENRKRLIISWIAIAIFCAAIAIAILILAASHGHQAYYLT